MLLDLCPSAQQRRWDKGGRRHHCKLYMWRSFQFLSCINCHETLRYQKLKSVLLYNITRHFPYSISDSTNKNEWFPLPCLLFICGTLYCLNKEHDQISYRALFTKFVFMNKMQWYSVRWQLLDLTAAWGSFISTKLILMNQGVRIGEHSILLKIFYCVCLSLSNASLRLVHRTIIDIVMNAYV